MSTVIVPVEKATLALYGMNPACCVVELMYVVIHAYVMTMAATAMTMRSNVAKIGDMAFFDFNMYLIDIFHSCPNFLFLTLEVLLFNSYEDRIQIQIKGRSDFVLSFRCHGDFRLVFDEYPKASRFARVQVVDWRCR
jgi:hypothetical protein